MWRGAHRGAGVTTLAGVFGGAEFGAGDTPGLPTLVVCRFSSEGLLAAQGLAASELADTALWTCLGLVTVAARPGRPGKPLEELAALVAGGYPRLWPIPWMESWRTPTGANREPGCLERLLHPVNREKEHR
jgi:hypothetical protein